jgi:oligopeptide transport system substrate-binding protein
MKGRTVFLSMLAIVLVMVLILAPACSSKTPSTASTPQILRVNLGAEPSTIDPNQASWDTHISVISQCFDGLLSFNTAGELQPDVATVVPSTANGGISSDGLTITFHLKTNVTWSDGTKVTANDFVYSIKREVSPTLACAYGSFYFNIVGAQAYYTATSDTPAQQAALAAAVGVSAPDDYTLVIKLNTPQETMLDCMALWCVDPVRADIIAKYGDNNWTDPPNYIGDGPYILTSWTHQTELVFKPNPNYWGTKPKLQEIDMMEITDANAALAAYQNNQLDEVLVPVSDYKTYLNDASYSNQRLLDTLLATEALYFNCTKAPFNNPLVRQAFACAVDRSALVNDVLAGVGKVTTSWIPPGMPGYDANAGSQYDFNVTKAKQLLAQAGYSDVSKLPQITYTYPNDTNDTTYAEFLQGQLKTNLGITITLNPEETNTYESDMSSSNFQFSWFGWVADYPDPDDWLFGEFITGGGVNEEQYSNPSYDTLAKKAETELDNTTRLSDWAQAQTMMLADAPIAPLYNDVRFMLVKPWVKGLTISPTDGHLPGDKLFRQVSIASH